MTIKRITVLLGLAFASAAIHAGAPSPSIRLLLSGPVESVDHGKNVVTVLGHSFVLRNSAFVLPGHRLDVFGSVSRDGTLKATMANDNAKYVASGENVYMVGAITALDRGRGTASIGRAVVDYTQLLSRMAFASPQIGDVVEVVGTQPAARQMILASRITHIQKAGPKAVGVSAGGQALGVSAGGQALGVSAGGQALGVSAGGQALGVSAGGQALGVSAGGQALGVSAGGQALGVSAGGKAVGVSAGGQALGVSAGGQALGVSAGGQALGVSAGGQRLGTL